MQGLLQENKEEEEEKGLNHLISLQDTRQPDNHGARLTDNQTTRQLCNQTTRELYN